MVYNSGGVKPGHLNMGRVIRNLSHVTDQSRKMTYHRPPIFGRDAYGVETTSVITEEILLPELPALMRPALTKSYRLERAGQNIVGAAAVYTENLKTIKGIANFDQDNNTNFNEIEGWDRFIDVDRHIYTMPTDVTSSAWAGTDWTFTSDGEKISAIHGGVDLTGAFVFTATGTNTLEADRVRFQVKASGSEPRLVDFQLNHGTAGAAYTLTYTPSSTLTIPTGSWLTVDVPFVIGVEGTSGPTSRTDNASGSSIYRHGARYNVGVVAGASFDFESDFRTFTLTTSGAAAAYTIYIKGMHYNKTINWHVHSLREYNSDYMVFNCVRVRGKRDSRRRAYG